ncbi:MAG: hypothetical protein JW973_11865 [Bacteroidales bacterium]|nr:hypothetical protein [Bacteroidales bacterium]
MNYKHTFEAAMANLAEINGLMQAFQDTGSVSSLEIDLVMQKTRNFYEILLLLKPDENRKPMSGHPDLSSVTGTETDRDQKPVSGKSVQGYDDSFEIDREPADENKPSTAETKHKKAEKEVLSDLLKREKLLGESLHESTQYQDISSRLHAKPVTDLVKAIGINERFLYIRELFGNDPKKYDKAIEVLNNAANFNDAYNFMIREYTWDMDSELVQGLLEVVRRKFITG